MGRTLLRVLAAVRWLCWVWMTAVVAFAGDALIHPIAAWLLVTVGGVTAAAATWAVRNRPALLLTHRWIIGEAVFALVLSVADGWVFRSGHVFVTSQDLGTEWALVVVMSTGLLAGPWIAAALGALFGPARLASALLNHFDHFDKRHLVAALATTIFYGAAGAISGWLLTLLRAAEAEISHRRARDEVARVMHDTVLQTLALVERRSADTDPDLAATARRADRELRSYLFGGDAPTGSLREAVHREVRRVSERFDRTITVNVIDDEDWLDGPLFDAVARAVGEATANAAEHAEATSIVVFAETRGKGSVFASVSDDGLGFDPAAAGDGHGLQQSIIARMEAVGGQAAVRSTDQGTEVTLWTN